MAAPTTLTDWQDKREQRLLDAVSLDAPWPVIEKFASLVRTSGSAEERQAFDLMMQHLQEWGVKHTLHEPECFISVPRGATVRDPASGHSFRAKTVSMSASTNGEELTGELVYIPASATASNAGDVFSIGVDLGATSVVGKIVITEGLAAPGKVTDVMNAGALAGIFINPGEQIHEGICTSIWGMPDLDSHGRQPNLPVAAVNHADGQQLIALAQRGGQVALSTRVETGWRTIPVLVAEIPGRRVPDEFVLVHGHVDSWHVGIGDNATGDATLLELARVFAQQPEALDRSVRIAWWSGHSHGRYAGSTWYADQFAIELANNCVAQINCDSPGCRWTDTYNELTAMSESAPFLDAVITETTGIKPQPERPVRAGDYSFNNIGITSYLMLSSTISPEGRRERGLYAVGGCGNNIEWHTEGDTLDIADRDTLLRDMRMYAAVVSRTANAPLHPFDWTKTTAEFAATLDEYAAATGKLFNFAPAREALAALDRALAVFYTHAPQAATVDSEAARRFNFAQRRLARILVPINYSRTGQFRHDPALNVLPLPDLAPALGMPAAAETPTNRNILRAHLQRGQNRLIWALQEARELVEAATPANE